MKKGTFAIVGLIFALVLAGCSKEPVVLDFATSVLEYGEEADFNSILKTEEIKINSYEYDSMKLGEQEVLFKVEDKDGDESEATFTFTVEDTKKPVIKLKEKTVTVKYGSKFDAKKNVKSCTDPIDGELEFTTEGKVDTKKAGKYTVTVTAKDKNGNETKVEYKVVVKEKEVEKQPSNNSSANNGSSIPSGGNSNGSSSGGSSVPSGGNSNSSSSGGSNGGSSGGSANVCKPGTPNPEEIGNSGLLFYGDDDYSAWFDKMDANNGELLYETYGAYGWTGWTITTDTCGNPMTSNVWTVHFIY